MEYKNNNDTVAALVRKKNHLGRNVDTIATELTRTLSVRNSK